MTEKYFAGTIKSGFRVYGLYPFDENAPHYDRCVRKDQPPANECKNSQNAPNRNEKISFFKFLEQQMDPRVLQSFKTSYSSHYFWSGVQRYL